MICSASRLVLTHPTQCMDFHFFLGNNCFKYNFAFRIALLLLSINNLKQRKR